MSQHGAFHSLLDLRVLRRLLLESSCSNTNPLYQPPQLFSMMSGRSLTLLAVDSLRHIKSQVRYSLFFRASVASQQNRLLIKPARNSHWKIQNGCKEQYYKATYFSLTNAFQKKYYHCKMDNTLKRGTEITTLCGLVSLRSV